MCEKGRGIVWFGARFGNIQVCLEGLYMGQMLNCPNLSVEEIYVFEINADEDESLVFFVITRERIEKVLRRIDLLRGNRETNCISQLQKKKK